MFKASAISASDRSSSSFDTIAARCRLAASTPPADPLHARRPPPSGHHRLVAKQRFVSCDNHSATTRSSGSPTPSAIPHRPVHRLDLGHADQDGPVVCRDPRLAGRHGRQSAVPEQRRTGVATKFGEDDPRPAAASRLLQKGRFDARLQPRRLEHAWRFSPRADKFRPAFRMHRTAASDTLPVEPFRHPRQRSVPKEFASRRCDPAEQGRAPAGRRRESHPPAKPRGPNRQPSPRPPSPPPVTGGRSATAAVMQVTHLPRRRSPERRVPRQTPSQSHAHVLLSRGPMASQTDAIAVGSH